ncbi:Heat shock protein [Nitratireductor basaltis]|uniref:Heat shock protein n=2 Tax=Nitratireductor basaltis TaxID=472175 RepID=A0A084UB68_9HYPH|nr:Heat shock protein [Nitratireductor basaltis]
MIVPFYLFGALLVTALFGMLFLKASPARISGAIRLVGPILLGIVGVVMLFTGRAGLGGMALSGALAWYGVQRRQAAAKPSQGQKSSVRTSWLEMELDHDTGDLEGSVLAGEFEGRNLSELTEDELLQLREALLNKQESLQLLETYLDGRFPVWRERFHADDRDGEGGAHGAGPMTEQEAYEILGLEPGASTADIRKAHRRLMQRVHPDMGGSPFLAARINEARDFLLGRH